MKLKEMLGMRVGKLTVIERVEDHYYPSGRHDAQYRCRCECGNEVIVLGIHLRSGHTTSCGCYRKETTSKARSAHRMTNTRLYRIWKGMKQRCLNSNHPNYNIYGGRGIRVCQEWADNFQNFMEWAVANGYSDNLSLDRIDVNGNYSPDNCRWVTQKEQCNNTRRNINITIQGETHTLKEWTEKLELNYGTVSCRIERGWDPIRALTT